MSGVVIPTIKSGTTEVQDLYELHYIEIVREVNRIPYARIEFLEGDPALQELDISDKDHFELGRKIEIRLRYEGAPKSVDQSISMPMAKMMVGRIRGDRK